MNRYVIESTFLMHRLTGVERVAIETIKRLDKKVPPGQLELLVMRQADREQAKRYFGTLENISVRVSFPALPDRLKNHFIWEQLYLPLYCLFSRRCMLALANDVPILATGVVCLHDILPLSRPTYFTDMRILSRLKLRLTNWSIVHTAKKLVTVSDYSRRDIRQYYHTKRDIDVIGDGWDHEADIVPDNSVFTQFPQIKKGEYYFMLGSLSPRKNQEWFESMACKYPDIQFVRTGGQLSRTAQTKKLPNLIYTGYLSDAQINALMRNMRALLFPSFEEGFGMPPMEAIALGKPALVAQASCMPEIYGDTVRYFDPNRKDTDLGQLLECPVKAPDELLRRYSWGNLSNLWFDLLYQSKKNRIPERGKTEKIRDCAADNCK